MCFLQLYWLYEIIIVYKYIYNYKIMAGVESQAFQVEKKTWREDTIDSSSLFNTLISKTQNYSEDHKKVWDLVKDIDAKLTNFKQNVDTSVQVWEKNMIWSFSESKFDRWTNKVLEQNFDKNMANLANRLNEITSKFNWNYEELSAQLTQLLDSDVFVNSLPKEKSLTEKVAAKLWIESSPWKPEVKKWALENWAEVLKQWYYSNSRTEKALKDAWV